MLLYEFLHLLCPRHCGDRLSLQQTGPAMSFKSFRTAVVTSLALVATCWPTLDYAQQQDDRLGVGPATGYLAYRVDAVEEGLMVCFPNYGAESRIVSNICVGKKLFEQVSNASSSLKHFEYHGMDLFIDKARLLNCWIPAYKDESGTHDNSSDGSDFQELTLECPYPNPSDGKYGLVISYNNSKYVPLKVFDYLCEPANVREGSTFDRLIRSQFGAPSRLQKEAAILGRRPAGLYTAET